MKVVDLDLRPKGPFMFCYYYHLNKFEGMEEVHVQIVDSLVFWVTRQDFVSPEATQ